VSIDVRLRPPRESDEKAVRAAHRALAAEDFEFALGLDKRMSWRQWMRLVAQEDAGLALPVDRVQATFLIADIGGTLAGRVSIRHRLNDWLRLYGGHIGYAVVPELRRQGVATQILRQSLVIVRAFGVDQVLITCRDDNVGSIAVIESCGGEPDPDLPYSPSTPSMRRYWVS
jgi:predicted acetyltransferase